MDCHINITIIPEHQMPFNLRIDCPSNPSQKGGIRQQLIEKHAEWGVLKIRHLWFGGICILKSELNPIGNCNIDVRCKYFCWLTNFVLEGSLQATVTHLPTTLHTVSGQYHAFCCNTFQATLSLENPIKLFSIYLDRPFIKGLFEDSAAGTADKKETHHFPDLVLDKEPTTPQLQSIIRDIFLADQPDHIKKIYLQSKVLELLSIQLGMKEKRPARATPPLPDKDIQKLYYAKSLIESNLRKPYSLAALSNNSGLNEFKLKNGFKQLFGTTVFGYLTELRMEKGKQLLQEGCTVNETADAMGYKNAHHFTAAFKKKWGVLPSKIRG